jgi:hypothetical protein
MGPEWISLDGSLPKVQGPCYFLDRENVFRGVMDVRGALLKMIIAQIHVAWNPKGKMGKVLNIQ